MIRTPNATTRVFSLLGDPVAHSLSPTFQNAALTAADLNGIYVALRCSPAEVPGLILGLARAGGGGNVTVPHKEIAARTVERPLEAVIHTGACNTFWEEGGVVHGDNTDIEGFERGVEQILGQSVSGGRVLLIGAGGAARSAAWALTRQGAAQVVVLNRTVSTARDLADRFTSPKTKFVVESDVSSLIGERFDLAVNATSLGLDDSDPLPLDFNCGVTISAAFDLVYSRTGTQWVQAARKFGIPAADGLEMLLQQGAAAFSRWWDVPVPLEAMRAALPLR